MSGAPDALVDFHTGPGWQLRGDLDLGDEELGAILGEELRRKLRVTSTSLWSGSGGSRTPLHRDDVSALVWQCVGRKRFFLVAEKDVEDAVSKGKLPSAVLEGGSESHCRDGSLEEVVFRVEIKASRRPPRHRRDTCPMTWRLGPSRSMRFAHRCSDYVRQNQHPRGGNSPS